MMLVSRYRKYSNVFVPSQMKGSIAEGKYMYWYRYYVVQPYQNSHSKTRALMFLFLLI